MIRWIITGQCEKLADVPSGANIVGIIERKVIGGCEMCGRYLLEVAIDPEYKEDALACEECRKAMKT